MPHVSKQKVHPRVLQEISKKFIIILNSLNHRKDSAKLYFELFTPTERLMLAKRLATIAMLHRGESLYRISSTLKISPSTAARIGSQYERGKFPFISSKVVRSSNFTEFLDSLFDLLTIMPPKIGRDRYKSFEGI